jgi:hypothetical protein
MSVMPRTECGLQREEVTGRGRNLYSEELRNWCCSRCVVRMVKWRWVRLAGEKNSEWKNPLGKPSCRWKITLNWTINRVRRCGLDLSLHDKDQLRLVCTVMKLGLTCNAGDLYYILLDRYLSLYFTVILPVLSGRRAPCVARFLVVL